MRNKVLRLYKVLVKFSKTWVSRNGIEEESQRERNYIISESRRLFRQNMHLQNEADIKNCINEAEARIEIADHYKTPYPRLPNIPQFTLPYSDGRMRKKGQKEFEKCIPSYMSSYRNDYLKK